MAGFGHFQMRGAQPEQVGHHGSARRGHDGRTAGRNHCLGGVERGARQAAAGESGDDLQERGGGHVSLAKGSGMWQVTRDDQ
jgi:hypothetical protein